MRVCALGELQVDGGVRGGPAELEYTDKSELAPERPESPGNNFKLILNDKIR